jgi:hypothetical protein
MVDVTIVDVLHRTDRMPVRSTSIPPDSWFSAA